MVEVSVIIPFYSNKKWLEEALESVFKQTYKNFEVILINDGSQEDISDLLERYEIVYLNQENKKAGYARNRGIEASTGKYIAFLDSDDIWVETKLEKQINFMKMNNFDWSHSSYTTFNEKKILKEITPKYFQGNVFPKILISCPIATPCVIIKKDIFDKNKNYRFSEKLSYGEDFSLWLCISQKYKLGYIDPSLVNVRIRGTNASMSTLIQIRHRLDIFRVLPSQKKYFSSQITYYIYFFIYFLCSLFAKIAIKLNIKNNTFLSLLYITPYFIFKIYNKLYKWKILH